MKIATWNVNSIRARIDRVLEWLGRESPDVLCLQEIKMVAEDFPTEELRAAGYRCAVFGQRTYNGVAIVSQTEPESIECGMDDGVDDPQARLIAATVGGVRVISAYVPNGEVVGSEKYAYKLAWLRRLRDHLARRCAPADPLVLCGDFNVARDDKDVARPDEWAGTVLCHEDSRAAFEEILGRGCADLLRSFHPDGGVYTWWDYRMLAFPRNNGLRLDYILATEPLARRCSSVAVDRDARKGPKPSDHAPVVAVFK